jgi:hypothetical protein
MIEALGIILTTVLIIQMFGFWMMLNSKFKKEESQLLTKYLLADSEIQKSKEETARLELEKHKILKDYMEFERSRPEAKPGSMAGVAMDILDKIGEE